MYLKILRKNDPSKALNKKYKKNAEYIYITQLGSNQLASTYTINVIGQNIWYRLWLKNIINISYINIAEPVSVEHNSAQTNWHQHIQLMPLAKTYDTSYGKKYDKDKFKMQIYIF
jgi:hypothetical protein